uniref:ShKT domain-containing protein n=1 Tax=Ciona savignyi TaxID=51511 RepID=H2YA93_CIOSA
MLCPKSCLTCTPPCEDQLVVCPQYSQNCSSSFIRTNCPKMCKQCGVPVVTATNETTSTDICKDTNPRCPEFKTSGLCTSKNFYDACPLSCGKCTSVKIPLNECKDQLSSCGVLVEKMQCTNSMVRRSCPQSCGLCTETTSAPVTVPTPQVCVDSHSNCSRWSQLGQCQNTFIKSLCKSSCRNCGARNAVVATPACSDQLGANCRLLTSRCSEVSVKMLCQKSCGFCGVPSV